MSEIWMNENWREDQLPPKKKRLYADAISAMRVLESNPETFDLYCLFYLLHGNKEKQWAYATNRPDVIGLMEQMLQKFLHSYKPESEIEFNFSYPRLAVQEQLSDVNNFPEKALEAVERKWVIHRWQQLLVTQLPERHSFNPRKNSRQRALSASDPPGTIEIRLRKSLGILMAFRHRGEQLLKKLAGQ